jgi:hypothetical protein
VDGVLDLVGRRRAKTLERFIVVVMASGVDLHGKSITGVYSLEAPISPPRSQFSRLKKGVNRSDIAIEVE